MVDLQIRLVSWNQILHLEITYSICRLNDASVRPQDQIFNLKFELQSRHHTWSMNQIINLICMSNIKSRHTILSADQTFNIDKQIQATNWSTYEILFS